MLLAHLAVAGERVTGRRLVGMVVGFVGVALIFRDDLQMAHPLAVTAAGVTLLSPLAAAVSNVAIKRWGGHLHPYTLTALPMTYASIGLFTVSWMTEDPSGVVWTPTAVGSVVYLGLFGSVAAFVIFYTLLKQVAVSTLAFVTYIFPVVALLLGYLLLGETLAAQSLIGAGVVVVGIAVATAAPRRT
jgi:drug/metabolite transporter (DMT)-like permease